MPIRGNAVQRWHSLRNHMPRAMGCFRAAGFDVEAWPVDYRTRGREDATRFLAQSDLLGFDGVVAAEGEAVLLQDVTVRRFARAGGRSGDTNGHPT